MAQNNASFGLVQPSSGDSDGNPDPLGSAGMVMSFDASSITLSSIGSTQMVTVETPFIPLGTSDSVQIILLHDSSKFTIQNPLCGAVYSGGTPIGPTANTGNTGTIIGCSLVGGAVANSGAVLTFDVVRADHGSQSFTLDSGVVSEGTGFIHSSVLVPNATLPSFDAAFAALIGGSFGLQAVSDTAVITLIAPTATAIPVSGAATENELGTYDPITGTFSINVIEPGNYDIQADASGFLSRRYQTVTVAADGSVTNEPLATTLRAGDVDQDGDIDAGDISIWLAAFGVTPVNRQVGADYVDIDGDDVVNARDLSLLISNFPLTPAGGAEDWLAP